jgi:glycosyltransferase involved in cell wall biosynthesis
MATPAVSVLMTAYNRERYIAASIESVLAQTFGDFELLVTDNQSSDRSAEIARDYARKDRRIRVVVNEANLGQFGNRNRAASLARGRFLKYHDSDDLMYPHCLATMLAPLLAEPRAAFALSVGWNWPGGPCPMFLTPEMCYQREFLGQGMFNAGPACALFRTEVFRDLGGFPDRGVASDYLFWLKACNRVNVLLVPADLFWYRIHPGQEFASENAAREYACGAGDAWLALRAPDCPLQGVDLEQAKRNWVYILARGAYRQIRAGRWRIARLIIRHSGVSWRDWIRYLRRPKRSMRAGTPLTEDGEYLTPNWSCFQIPEEIPRFAEMVDELEPQKSKSFQ